jgi:hypothetical protein
MLPTMAISVIFSQMKTSTGAYTDLAQDSNAIRTLSDLKLELC